MLGTKNLSPPPPHNESCAGLAPPRLQLSVKYPSLGRAFTLHTTRFIKWCNSSDNFLNISTLRNHIQYTLYYPLSKQPIFS